MELIKKSALVEKLGEWRYKIRFAIDIIPLHGRERADATFAYELLGKVKNFVNTFDTLEVKEVDSNDAFIEKAWDWIEDNLLSSNQQDKSRLYFEQFKNYIKE